MISKFFFKLQFDKMERNSFKVERKLSPIFWIEKKRFLKGNIDKTTFEFLSIKFYI